jgi:DnaJ like chaperone protein
LSKTPTDKITLRKSLWSQLLSRLQAIKSGITSPFTNGKGVDSVTFSISFIALSAKLAKADGQVTSDEVRMFRKIFLIPPEEEARAAKVYNLCRQDTSGFDVYARNMSQTLGTGPDADGIRRDVLDGLFHIAMADNEYHPGEDAFLREVAEIFEITKNEFASMVARHVPSEEDPFLVLGVDSKISSTDLKKVWRKLMRENHPDKIIARGLPADMVQIADARAASFNKAYRDILELRNEYSPPDFD